MALMPLLLHTPVLINTGCAIIKDASQHLDGAEKRQFGWRLWVCLIALHLRSKCIRPTKRCTLLSPSCSDCQSAVNGFCSDHVAIGRATATTCIPTAD